MGTGPTSGTSKRRCLTGSAEDPHGCVSQACSDEHCQKTWLYAQYTTRGENSLSWSLSCEASLDQHVSISRSVCRYVHPPLCMQRILFPIVLGDRSMHQRDVSTRCVTISVAVHAPGLYVSQITFYVYTLARIGSATGGYVDKTVAVDVPHLYRMSEPIFLAPITLLQDAEAINSQEPHIQSLTQEHSILECFWKLIEMYLIMETSCNLVCQGQKDWAFFPAMRKRSVTYPRL